MAYTFIQDNSTVTLDKVKKFCRIDPDDDSYDVPLEYILAGIKSKADEYCNNPDFEDWGGVVPSAVELWILQMCLTVYENPNLMRIRTDTQDEGADYFEYQWERLVEPLNTFRLETGFN